MKQLCSSSASHTWFRAESQELVPGFKSSSLVKSATGILDFFVVSICALSLDDLNTILSLNYIYIYIYMEIDSSLDQTSV